MRKVVLGTALVLAMGFGFDRADRAHAMPAFPGGLQAAVNGASQVEQVAQCQRWRGLGWYPCRRHAGPRTYAPRVYSWHRSYRPYRYSYGYRWRHHYWR